MYKHILLFTTLFLFSQMGLAQTSISGIINDYAAVAEIKNCESKIIVDDATNFAPDDLVILLQMQGATIKNADNAEFGDIEDLGSAGLYEKAEILSVVGNEIIFKKILVNEYDVAGNVQLISLPKYENATVIAPVTGQLWNGATGGVVAIEVENTLTLEADISATGLGFRGGLKEIVSSDCSFLTNANDYFYDANNWRGSSKGEGIATIITNKERGRGAQANGGGGGNDHNTGGGGGGNITNGGQGGEQNAPGTFGCRGENPGVGGKGIAATETRLFLGGGGGAGHFDNNNAGSSGGNGGGIIIVIANTIVAGGNQLVANGLTPNLAGGDGAGGGGAGGSIVAIVQNIMGLVEVNALGGDGGDTNNPADRCFGPGGGGSGGRILTSTTPSNFSLVGGIAGINSTASSECTGLSNGALDGQSGVFGVLSSFVEGDMEIMATSITTQPSSTTICTGDDYLMTAEVTGNNLSFQWQINTGSGFVDLQNGPNYSGVTSTNLQIQDVDTGMDGNQFQLIIGDMCAGDLTSTAATIEVGAGTVADFSFSNLGSGMFQFANLSSNFNNVAWDFGDTNMSTMANPTHSFDEGNFTVTLTAFGDCDTVSIMQNIDVTAMPTADFSFTTDGDCVPVAVQFTNESSENSDSYTWMFDGGLPALSSMENPTVTYNSAGTFDVTLIVFNSEGSDTLTQVGGIVVQDFPTVDFSFMSNGLTVNFTSMVQNGGGTLLWDFGDNMTSTVPNPTHTYAASGVYEVTLTVSNDCGDVTATEEVSTGVLPMAVFSSNLNSDCVPLTAFFTDLSGGTDITEWFWEFPGGTPATSTSENPQVFYDTPGLYDVTLTVTNDLGSNTTTYSNHIVANAFPNANFEFDIMDNVVTFTNTSVGGNTFTWDFGDGSPTTNETNPTHTYNSNGIFSVTLIASNLSCANVQSEELFIDFSADEEVLKNELINVYPNPAIDVLTVELADNLQEEVTLRLYDVQGRMWRQQIVTIGNKGQMEVANLASGVYILEISTEKETMIQRILKN